MSILFRHSCFVHLPRTGGTWLQNAVLRADVKCNILKVDIDSHLPFSQLCRILRTAIVLSHFTALFQIQVAPCSDSRNSDSRVGGRDNNPFQ